MFKSIAGGISFRLDKVSNGYVLQLFHPDEETTTEVFNCDERRGVTMAHALSSALWSIVENCDGGEVEFSPTSGRSAVVEVLVREDFE